MESLTQPRHQHIATSKVLVVQTEWSSGDDHEFVLCDTICYAQQRLTLMYNYIYHIVLPQFHLISFSFIYWRLLSIKNKVLLHQTQRKSIGVTWIMFSFMDTLLQASKDRLHYLLHAIYHSDNESGMWVNTKIIRHDGYWLKNNHLNPIILACARNKLKLNVSLI